MANIAHSTLTDPNLHEPKGVAAAAVNHVYVSDGAGSGNWTPRAHGAIYYKDLTTGTSITYPSSYTKVNPTTTAIGIARSVTEGTNARVTYTGTPTINGRVLCTLVFDQSSGSDRDINFAIYKNGSIVAASETMQTARSGDKVTHTIQTDLSVATNDYFEVYVKNAGASGAVKIYKLAISFMGISR